MALARNIGPYAPKDPNFGVYQGYLQGRAGSGTGPVKSGAVYGANLMGLQNSSRSGGAGGTSGGGGIAPTTQAVQGAATSEPTEQPQIDPYEPIYSELDRQINFLPQQQEQLLGELKTLAGTQTSGVETQRDQVLGKFPGYRSEVQENQSESLGNLAKDVRNLFQAGNTYLGARGAGDSSASNMYSYALQKEANQQRGGVLKQSNKMLNDINMKEADVKNTATNQIKEIDTWLASQTANLSKEFMGMRNELMSQKANVRSQSLAFWWDRLNQLQAQADQYKTAVSQWGQDRLSQINNYKMQLGQLGQYSPQQIVTQEIAGIPQFQSDASASYYNMFPRRREEEQQLIGRLS